MKPHLDISCSLPQSLKQPVEFDQAINYVNKIKVRVVPRNSRAMDVVGLGMFHSHMSHLLLT